MIKLRKEKKKEKEKPESLHIATTQLSKSSETELSRTSKRATRNKRRNVHIPRTLFDSLSLLPSIATASFLKDEKLLGQ
jgi:hypothetical protein